LAVAVTAVSDMSVCPQGCKVIAHFIALLLFSQGVWKFVLKQRNYFSIRTFAEIGQIINNQLLVIAVI
jgi:hypothetical protein